MNNSQVIENGLKLSLQKIGVRTLSALTKTSEELLDMTDVPVWTYNLQDSIGCAVYEQGAVMSYAVPAKEASEPRSGAKDFAMADRYDKSSARPIWDVDGIDEDRAYWGQDELFDMIRNPSAQVTQTKWAMSYIAAMPYSQVVDARVDIMEEQMMPTLFLKNIRK